MSYKNYILIQKHLFRSEYIFADTEEYLADQLFKNEKIRVNFGKEFGHTEEKYLLILILSRLVDTFFSRISPTMQLPPKHHSIAYVLPWAEGLHWQSRSSGCSNS